MENISQQYSPLPNPYAGIEKSEKNEKRRSPLILILILIILLFFLGISLYLLRTKTSFFNFASELNVSETISSPKAIPTILPTPEVSREEVTNIEISTSSSTVAVPVPTVVATPASIVLENSYMFASPLSAATGNVEKIRVTVFILDGTGSGISGKTVVLTGTSALAVTTIQSVTDSTGKATFDVAAGTSGTYTIGATVDGHSINQTVALVFD